MSNQDIAYDALDFDGTERRANYRIIAFREDNLQAFDRKDSAAIIFGVVYRWQTEYKKPAVLKEIADRKRAGLPPLTPEEVEERMLVYMSYNDFVRETGGAVAYNTVIRTIDYLVNEKKVLIQRPNTNNQYSDFMYTVNKEVYRELLKGLPKSPAITPKLPKKKRSTQMGTPAQESDCSTHFENDSTQMGTGSTHLGREVYPNGGTSQEHTGYSHDPHKRENSQQPQEQKEASPSLSDKKVADEEVKRRITAFIAIVTTLRRKAFNDEGLDAGIPNEKTMSLLTEMLTKREIPREEQERVFQAYWEHVDENGIHWWRDPNKLTINSYVKNYASRLTSLNNPQQQPSRKGKGAQTIVQPFSTEQQQQEKQGNLAALVRAAKSNTQFLKSRPELLVTYPDLRAMLEREGVAIPC